MVTRWRGAAPPHIQGLSAECPRQFCRVFRCQRARDDRAGCRPPGRPEAVPVRARRLAHIRRHNRRGQGSAQGERYYEAEPRREFAHGVMLATSRPLVNFGAEPLRVASVCIAHQATAVACRAEALDRLRVCKVSHGLNASECVRPETEPGLSAALTTFPGRACTTRSG